MSETRRPLTPEHREMLRVAGDLLLETPERYKRERLYEMLEPRFPEHVQAMREALGDTDGDRDTHDEPDPSESS